MAYRRRHNWKKPAKPLQHLPSLKVGAFSVDLKIYQNQNNTIWGGISVSGGKITAETGCEFFWRQSKYPRPYVKNVRGETKDYEKAAQFAAHVINAWAADTLRDCGGSSQSSGTPDPDYVSQLINAGHVRKPCVVRHSDGSVYLRRATVVNGRKLASEDYQRAKQLVDTWNTLMKLFQDKLGDPVKFSEWFEAQYGAVSA